MYVFACMCVRAGGGEGMKQGKIGQCSACLSINYTVQNPSTWIHQVSLIISSFVLLTSPSKHPT